MTTLRITLEGLFEWIARRVTAHPYRVIGGFLLLLLLTVQGLERVRVNPGVDSFFHESDPSFADYQRFKDEFGTDARVVITIAPDEVFNLDFLTRLRAMHEELEAEVPHLDEVRSLINATTTEGKDGQLIIEDLLENWPDTPEALARVKQKALSLPSWRGWLLSDDASVTTITLLVDVYALDAAPPEAEFPENEFDFNAQPSTIGGEPQKRKLTVKQTDEFVDAIKTITNRYNSDDFPISMAGGPVMEQAHVQIIGQVMSTSFAGLFVLILLTLLLIFRRTTGVAMPVMVTLFSVLLAYGFYGWIGMEITLISQLIPTMLLAFSVLDSVHILTVFYNTYSHRDQKRDALIHAIKHSGPAVLFTSLTTAAGFLSFLGAEVRATSDLAIMVPFGVAVALLLTLVVMPAVMMILPSRPSNARAGNTFTNRLDKQLARLSGFGIAHARSVCLAVLVITVTGLIGISLLTTYFNPIGMLPEDHIVRLDTQHIDQQMGSSQTLEILIDTGEENGLYNPAVQAKLQELNTYAETLSVDGKPVPLSLSIVDILKQINRSLNDNNNLYYAIPDDRNLIAQEILLFENGGADDLEDVVDSQLSKARVSVFVPNVNALLYQSLISNLTEKSETLFADLAQVKVTGLVQVNSTMVSNMMSSLKSSYLYATLAITLMMIIFLKNLKTGLISMVPNFLPIVITLGLMGFLGWPITIVTLLIGGVALGIVVDDTVHFLHNYNKAFAESGNRRQSIQQATQNIGRAITFTTLILACGFAIFISAPLEDVRNFGLLMALTLVLAWLADLVVVPALIMTLTRDRASATSHLGQYAGSDG